MKGDGLIYKAARNRRGWTQKELGERAGFDAQLISRLERGDSRVEQWRRMKIAEMLGLEFDPVAKRVLQPADMSDEDIAAWAKTRDQEEKPRRMTVDEWFEWMQSEAAGAGLTIPEWFRRWEQQRGPKVHRIAAKPSRRDPD